MGKECFTCGNKITTELSKEYGEKLRKERNLLFRPTLIFHCGLDGREIKQVDPACDMYVADADMVMVRKELSDTVKKLRKELNKS